MLNFSKFILFISLIIALPVIVSIIDNLVKIFSMIFHKNYICNKIVQLSDREFLEFVLEFFKRRYGYVFEFNEEDVYLKDGDKSIWLYYDNKNCDILNVDDSRKIIGLCESKGVANIFIFTTKKLSRESIEFFNSVSSLYDVKYVHKKDLDVSYTEFVFKFYSV